MKAKIDFRPEVNGLRALAVMAVILFHAGFSSFKGGFIGVDVFFVISGYLITYIMLVEKQAGVFSLVHFYERRVKRILPALFFVIASTLPFAWFLMNPHQLKEFSQSVAAVSIFLSNVLFWQQSNYFDAEAALRPLLHTWSLGVEEQYYILFPLLFLFFWKIKTKLSLTLILVLSVASFYWGYVQNIEQPATAFFMLPSRVWEFFVGVAIAYYFFKDFSNKITPAIQGLLALVGIVFLITSVVIFDEHTPFPSLYTVIPILGASLVIMFSKRDNLVGRLLSTKLMLWIGLISYSAYLWHQPVLSFLRIYHRGAEFTLLDYFIYFILTFGLAHLSYKFIENPIRKAKARTITVFASAAFFLACFVVVGSIGSKTDGFLYQKIYNSQSINKGAFFDPLKEKNEYFKILDKHKSNLNNYSFDGDKRKVLIIGDSVARDLATTFVENQPFFARDQFKLVLFNNTCLYKYRAGADICDLDLTHSSHLIKEADLVIVSFLWRKDQDVTLIQELFKKINALNTRVRVLGSASFIDMASVSYDIARVNKPLTQADVNRIVYESRRIKFEEGNQIAERFAKEFNYPYFDRKQLYCDDTKKECEIIILSKGSLIWDNTHLTKQGISVTANKIISSDILKPVN